MTKDWIPNFRDHFQMSNMFFNTSWEDCELPWRCNAWDFALWKTFRWLGKGWLGMARDSLHVEEKDVQSWWLAELHDGTGWADTHRTHCRPSFSDMTLEHDWNIFPPVDWSWDTPSPAMLCDGVKSTRSQCVVPKWSGSMRRCCAKQRRVGVALECFISPGKFDEIRMWSTLLWHICWLSIESRYSWTCNCRHVLIEYPVFWHTE